MKRIPLHVFSERRGNDAPSVKRLSASGRHNQYLRAGIDFFFAEKASRAVTFLWLYWALAKFEVLLLRPAILFSPTTVWGKIWFGALPAEEVFWTMIAVAAVLNGVQLFRGSRVLWQAFLTILLLWVNSVLWSYGYLPYVNHLFLLAHLFLVFAFLSRKEVAAVAKEEYAGICLFYFGLLFTYTLAGIWKVGGLGYKLLTGSTDVHWLKPEAALYNALVNFRDYDRPLTFAHLFLEYPWVWQVGFVGVVYLQVAAVWAAWRPALRPWIGAFLIGFHLLNQFAFLVNFAVSCLVLFCLFFPYSLFSKIFRKERRAPMLQEFKGEKRNARFTCFYPNGDQDTFTGFEAYRQRLLQKHYYFFGILYLPGLKTGIELYWRLVAWLSGEKAAPVF